MIEEGDIYRSASLLIKQYGEKAGEHALINIMSSRRKGDAANAALWTRVHRAISRLHQTHLEDEFVH